MSKPLVHTPEGVRDIYGEEYLRKLLVEEKLHHTLRSFGYQDIQTLPLNFSMCSAGKSAPHHPGAI